MTASKRRNNLNSRPVVQNSNGFVRLNLERLECRDVPAIFHVNTYNDTSDANLADNFPSDANGNTSLRAAVEQSNATGSGDFTIYFDSFLADENDEINLTITKSINITKPITIDGFSGYAKNASITGSGQFSLFKHSATSGTLNNLVFQNADAGIDLGGAIQNSGGLGVFTCEFFSNKATKGGAIANSGGSTLVVGESSFQFNSAPSGEGGAIYSADNSSVSIYYSTFNVNTAVKGGALASNKATTYIEYGFFYLNFAGDAGAIYMSEGDMKVVSSTFLENGAITNGGAILISRDCFVEISETSFAGNISQNGSGGAIFLDVATLALDGCTFESNKANTGDGHCVKIVGILNTTVWFSQVNCTFQNDINDIVN